jgi:hypothetical protein
MKIIFLCGSLEPGKDGVGDYTRRLAGELIRQGHFCGIIAIMDKETQEIRQENQDGENINIPVLRLPFDKGLVLNCKEAKNWVDTFDPDWVSLQYVPFSFHSKGLPFGLGNAMQQLTKGRKLHIMFHELWVGISIVSPFKHKILGNFQRFIVKKLVRKLKPNSISTSNFLYQLVLKSGGIEADILYLFSNIPKVKTEESFRNDLLDNLKIQQEETENVLFTGVFGSIYPEANIEKVLYELLDRVNVTDKKIVFISFGRIGVDGEKELKRLEILFTGKLVIVNLGELSQQRVSTLFHLLNVGISCTPLQHIGKSGVFAAMKLHNLEVLISAGEEIPEYEEQLKKVMPDFINRPPEMWGVEYIANNFASLLNNSKA